MTVANATCVPLPTHTYITAFVPLERMADRDLARLVWIQKYPPRLCAGDDIALLREAFRSVDHCSRALATWIAHAPRAGICPRFTW
jgi:hypothetical protein